MNNFDNFKIRTFGRIKSRGFSEAKIDKLNNVLPNYTVKIENNEEIQNLSANNDRLFFEIGFGYGEHTAHQALLNKNTKIVACETYINGVLSLLDKIIVNEIKNIKIFNGDARLLLEKMPDNSIDKVFILFPDPWPKKKQNKKRIINDEFLNLLKQKLKSDGTLFFASDILNYVEWTLNFADGKFQKMFNNLEECKKEPEWWIKTRYQTKAIKEGRESYFLEFKNIK